MSSAVEASVDSFFGESPEVERASRTSQSMSSRSSLTESESDSESSGESTARSSSSSTSSIGSVGPQPAEDNDKAEIQSEETKEPEQAEPEPIPVSPIGLLPVRASMESEGELTDISPMVTPRPSALAVDDSIDVNNDEVETGAGDIRVTVTRPKSAHPSRSRGAPGGRAPSTTSSSVNSLAGSHRSSRDFELDSARNESDIRKHRDRLLYSTSKSTKDLNHLLEAVLVLDQKMADRDEAKDPNPFPPKAVGGSRASSARGSRKSSFTVDRQREIQKENERLLRELTKQKSRRPVSAVSQTSVRSTASSRSRMSAISAASAIEFRKTVSCRAAPIARQYHSSINRTKEARRIDEENLALLRRLQSVRASPAIQMSRHAVMRPASSSVRTRPKSVRPKIVNTWTDGW